ncbi:DUF551 domain-containing protein [Klebsiella pneumoniae]|uniref:DUF551 domain-containing protein n=1 Tax=Klebsiella pneumoniae TaxID=573 RepID=UPI003B2823BB
MSEFSRETLLNIIETDHVQCGEASALARMALAAMDSEPVAWTDEQELRDVDRGGCGYLFTVNPVTPHADERRIILLYRHAQQPVVPDDVLDALQKVARIRLDLNDFDGDRRGIADCLGDAEEALIEVVNRRAAMLAAAPHDTPALNSLQSVDSVTGGWIPVSERMPEDDDFVYIWPRPDFGVELHVGQYCECSPKGDGWYAQVYEQNYGIEWHPITVTHWMPLPAAPQEVKGE